MKIDVVVPSFAQLTSGVADDIFDAAREAIDDTLPGAKEELRGQIIGAGLGGRLAKTWQGRTYANAGTQAGPAGFIWSKAPAIIDAFARGAMIRPVNGAQYLWIPTKNVPRKRNGRLTPSEVESRFNTDFTIVRRGASLLAFIDVVAALNARGLRAATKGRTARGRAAKPVLMFVLRRSVKMPQLLDLDAPAKHWADSFETAFDNCLGGR